jgi:hypothetical protein
MILGDIILVYLELRHGLGGNYKVLSHFLVTDNGGFSIHCLASTHEISPRPSSPFQ